MDRDPDSLATAIAERAIGWRQLQAALTAQAASVASPAWVIDEAVEKATGSRVVSAERVTRGEINEVWAVQSADGQALVVRICRLRPHFEDERWAIDAARAAGVPAPEVLLIAPFEIDGQTVEVGVQRRLPGRGLDEVLFGARPPEAVDVHTWMRAAGALLAGIHGVSVDGFGHLDSAGHAADPTWSRFLDFAERGGDQIRSAAVANGLEVSQFDAAKDVIRRHREVYDGHPPKLVHGDFHPKHLLVHGATVSGVVDFEACRGGDPAYDVATWDFAYEGVLPTEWLIEGYVEVAPLGDDWELRIRLCRVVLGLF